MQPLHLAARQAHGLEAVLGPELVELFLEQAEQVPGIEAGARGADREALRLAIQPIAGEVQLARPAFMRPQRFRQSLQQQIERAVDIGALHDRLGEIHPHIALRRRQQRRHRLVQPAQRLVQPVHQHRAEPPRQGGARQGAEIGDVLQSQALQLRAQFFRQAQGKRAAIRTERRAARHAARSGWSASGRRRSAPRPRPRRWYRQRRSGDGCRSCACAGRDRRACALRCPTDARSRRYPASGHRRRRSPPAARSASPNRRGA